MTRCPECDTVQTRESPFCENCGFRLRSQATVMEGLVAIAPASRVTAEELPAIRVPSPSFEEMTEPEEAGAVPSGLARQDPPRPSASPTLASPTVNAAQLPEQGQGARGASRRVDTAVEGRAAVRTNSAPITAPRPVVRPADASVSSLLVMPPDQGAGRVSRAQLILFTALWALIVALAALAIVGARAYEVSTVARAPAEVIPQAKLTIPAGSFKRGLDESTRAFILRTCLRMANDPDADCDQDTLLRGEFPQAEVNLPAFRIDARELSVEEYSRCVDAGACTPIDYKACQVYTPQGLQIALRVPKLLHQPELAQSCMRLPDAQAYCAWAGGALPSDDQWEKAARGDDGRLFPWGTTWGPSLANWGEFDLIRTPAPGKLDGHEWPAPPGGYPEGASPYGARDMAGNLAEWTQPAADDEAHARGGSWTSDPFSLRVTARLRLGADARRTDVGARCAYP